MNDELKTLTKAAHFINDRKEELIDAWEKRARETVTPARDSETLLLRNHLAELLDDMQLALFAIAEDDLGARERVSDTFTSKLSNLHSESRSDQPGYHVHHVLEEYVLLRQVVTDALIAENLLGLRSVEAVNRMFEMSSLAAVKKFQDTVNENQRRVVATITHDIRSPLSVVEMSLEAVSQFLEASPGEARQFLKMASDAAGRALGMSVKILDSVSPNTTASMKLNFEKANLDALLRDTVETQRMRYGDLLVYRSPDSPQDGVFATEIIVRVVENLISNAFKYGASTEPVTVKLTDEGETAEIAVHNHGEPILPEQQKAIFQMFQKEPDRSPATGERSWGLGLTYVNLAAKIHDGIASLTSNEEQGTTFSIRFIKDHRDPGEKLVKSSELNNDFDAQG